VECALALDGVVCGKYKLKKGKIGRRALLGGHTNRGPDENGPSFLVGGSPGTGGEEKGTVKTKKKKPGAGEKGETAKRIS